MRRSRISSGSIWEKQFGYARAARAGSFVAVSGTVAADAEGRPAAADAYGQTKHVLHAIDEALREAGGTLADVVRLRVYFVRPDVSDGFSRALDERFPGGAPALTAVRVSGLVDEAFLLEIEADAVLSEEHRKRDPDVPEWDEQAD